MTTTYLFPSFNKSEKDKINVKIDVVFPNVVVQTVESNYAVPAIASEGFPANRDGTYIFVTFIENVMRNSVNIGFTSTKTVDSRSKCVYPSYGGMNGVCLFLHFGNLSGGTGESLQPWNENYLPEATTKKATEIIAILTISNGGTKKAIQFVVDGIEGKVHELATEYFDNKNGGSEIFPVVTLAETGQKLEMIPFDQVKSRSRKIYELMKQFSSTKTNNNGAAIASSNNNNAQQQTSAVLAQLQVASPLNNNDIAQHHPNNNNTAALTQLQQELEKERKRADLAESQLDYEKKNSDSLKNQLSQEKQNLLSLSSHIQRTERALQNEKNISSSLTNQLNQEKQRSSSLIQQKDQELENEKKSSSSKDSKISTLEQEVSNLKQQLQSSLSLSAFIKDKPYQIDFAANGLPLPTDRSTFGSLLPVAQTSPIFLEARKLMRKLGSFYPSQKPVAGFTLEAVDVIAKSVAGFEDGLHNLQQVRTHGGGIFNPSTTKYSAEQLQVLIYLNKLFLDRPSDAHDKAPDLINVFHGTKRGVLQSAVNTLVALRSTDAGFFGLGAYTTPNIEYAARYATGEFNPTSTDFTPRADGSFPVIWCVAAVGVCYPLTREKDYGQNKQWNGMGVSDFFGSPLKSDPNGKFDCHCVLVNESANYQAVPRNHMQYMEIVFDQTSQVLPIAVLWMKPV